MSPLARIRQVATCLVFASFAGLAPGITGPVLAAAGLAAAADSPARSPAQASPPASAAQSSPQAQPAEATAAPQKAQPPPRSPPSQANTAALAPQPLEPVQLAPNATAQIARSALLGVEGTATGDTLRISIRRASDQSLISGDDVTVAVDGKNQSVTHGKGSAAYELPINDLRGDGARDVDVTVGHDGIREIVSGKVSVAEAASASSLLSDHKQIAWWILNIVIVLIAATAFSRRKG
jgi:hypothetical protein